MHEGRAGGQNMQLEAGGTSAQRLYLPISSGRWSSSQKEKKKITNEEIKEKRLEHSQGIQRSLHSAL